MRFLDLHTLKISPCSSGTSCCSRRKSRSTKLRSVLDCMLCSSYCNSKMTNPDISDYTATTNAKATITQTQVRSGNSLHPDVLQSDASTEISEYQPEVRSSVLCQCDIIPVGSCRADTSSSVMVKKKEPSKESMLFANGREIAVTRQKEAPIKEIGEEIVKDAVEMKGREVRAKKKAAKTKKLAKKNKKKAVKKKENVPKVQKNLRKGEYSETTTKGKDRLEELEHELKNLKDAIEKKRKKIKQMKADNKNSESLMLMLKRNFYITKSWWKEKRLYMSLTKLRCLKERNSKLIQKYRAKIFGCISSQQWPTEDHLSQENEHGDSDSDSTVSSMGTSYIDPYRPIIPQCITDENLGDDDMWSTEERLYALFLSRCDLRVPEVNASVLFNSNNKGM